MASSTGPTRPQPTAKQRQRLTRLRDERRRLAARLAKLDRELSLLAQRRPKSPPSPDDVARWFDELSEGLDHLPPLPADFSRADLYDDHD